MLLYHILGWVTVAGASGLGVWLLWFSAGGWRQFGPPHLLPPPVPKLALAVPAIDPKPGFSDYVGAL
jgi:hypothetical protein